MSNLWAFVLDNAGAISALVAILALCGGFVVWIMNRLKESGSKKGAKINQLEAEMLKLKEENSSLRKELSLFKEVESATDGNYLILKEIRQAICPVCWGKDNKPILIYCNDNDGSYKCGNCNNTGIFSFQKNREYDKRQSEAFENYNRIKQNHADNFNEKGWF